MAPPRMLVNDVDLSLFEMWVNVPDGWGDAPKIEDTVVPIYGSAGGMLFPQQAGIQSRTLSVAGIIYAATPLLAQGLWDDVKQLLSGPEVEIRFTSWPDRKAVARYQSMEWLTLGSMEDGFAFRLTFLMPNPYLIGTQVDTYCIPNGTEKALILGTAPSFVNYTIIGINNPTPAIVYRDAQGVQRGLVSYNTGDIMPDKEFIEFDGMTHVQLFHRLDNTLIVNATGFVVDNVYFVADPADGDELQGPTLEAVNCDIVAMIRRAYR